MYFFKAGLVKRPVFLLPLIDHFLSVIEARHPPGEKIFHFFLQTLASSENTVNLCVIGLDTQATVPNLLLQANFNLLFYPPILLVKVIYSSNACGPYNLILTL